MPSVRGRLKSRLNGPHSVRPRSLPSQASRALRRPFLMARLGHFQLPLYWGVQRLESAQGSRASRSTRREAREECAERQRPNGRTLWPQASEARF
jgi:hypothetical protein